MGARGQERREWARCSILVAPSAITRLPLDCHLVVAGPRHSIRSAGTKLLRGRGLAVEAEASPSAREFLSPPVQHPYRLVDSTLIDILMESSKTLRLRFFPKATSRRVATTAI